MQEEGRFFIKNGIAEYRREQNTTKQPKRNSPKVNSQEKSVLATMDICGAMALKSRYDNVITIYIKKDRKELISSILNKKCSHEDKVNRLISIEDEKRNEEICDYVVSVTNKDYDSSVKEIEEILGI